MSETTIGIQPLIPDNWLGNTTTEIHTSLLGNWCGTTTSHPPDLEVTLTGLFEELRELLLERYRAYGPRNIAASGIHWVVVRMSDKLAQIENAHEGCSLGFCRPHASSQAWEDPMVEDAWKDLANYTIIGLLVQRGLWPDS